MNEMPSPDPRLDTVKRYVDDIGNVVKKGAVTNATIRRRFPPQELRDAWKDVLDTVVGGLGHLHHLLARAPGFVEAVAAIKESTVRVRQLLDEAVGSAQIDDQHRRDRRQPDRRAQQP